MLDKGQVNRWWGKGGFPEPASKRPQKAGIVEIQMRPVTEKLKSFVTRLPYGFQQIHSDRLPAVNLRRDTEFHEHIVL